MVENDLIIARVKDKISLAKRKNKIQNTTFFTTQEVSLIKKELAHLKEKGYLFSGGYKEAERQVLIAYPEKFDENIVKKNASEILKTIKIELPNELKTKYQHKDYLGSLMRLGLERERYGDIICFDDVAYIVVLKENADYISENLGYLIKFKKSKISVIDIDEIKVKLVEFEDIKIVIASERLDNFVSELAKISRSEAITYLENERIFVNGTSEIKPSKTIKAGDVLTIRGKGKFIVSEYAGLNKREKKVYEIKKYK